MSILKAHNIEKHFAEGRGESVAVLKGIDFSVERGEIVSLEGPSGSGKTTFLTLVGCLRAVQAGSVRLLGQELAGASEDMLVACRRRLGFIFQAHNLHESLTARQNVLMGLEVHGRGHPERQNAAAEHILGLLGLGHRVDYLPENLSGGQKQRVAIARALVSNPEVVFADEPTAALDREAGQQVVRMLKALGRERGTTTVMVTHDNRILELADRILTLEDGRIVSDTAEAKLTTAHLARSASG